jgi:hypothetical protein
LTTFHFLYTVQFLLLLHRFTHCILFTSIL